MKQFDLLRAPLVGRNLIEASAGTGKTYAIAGLFVRLILEKGLTVDQILVVTFTEAATGELKDRIRNRLRDALTAFGEGDSPDSLLTGLLERVRDHALSRARLTRALGSFDEAAIHTIHGFCQRTLGGLAFESGSLFDTDLEPDPQPLFRGLVDDFWRSRMLETDPGFARWMDQGGLTAEHLARFALRWGRRTGLTVLPDDDEPDTRGCIRAYGEVLEKAREEFGRSRARISDLLENHPGLNRNRYRKTSIPGWLDSMEEWLDESLPLKPFQHFDRFQAQVLGESLKKNAQTPEHRFFDLCDELARHLEIVGGAMARRVSSLKRNLLRYVKTEFPHRKMRLNVRTFDDLLLDLDQALNREGGSALARAVRNQHPAALIDEFQDTDSVQYSIFRTVYDSGDPIVFFIGDPKQAIYGFRGADVFAYLAARCDVPEDSHRTLDINWRSAPGLIDAVNTLFGGVDRPFLLDAIPFEPASPPSVEDRDVLVLDGRPDSEPLQVWQLETKDGKPLDKGTAGTSVQESVAGEVVRLLNRAAGGRASIAARQNTEDARRLEPEDIAILVRTNRQARAMQRELRARGVPSVLHGDASLFESPEASDVLRILTGVADPGNESAVRTALVTEVLGVSGVGLARLNENEPDWSRTLERFRHYRRLWAKRSFMSMARALMTGERVREVLLALPDGERRLTNVLHCFDVLHQASLERKLGVDGLLKWFVQHLTDTSARDQFQIRLESDDKAVKLVTIHRSKGLEYPVVFVPFSWGAAGLPGDEPLSFHPRENDPALVLDLGPKYGEGHREKTLREILAEDLRLLYVALTRARHRCYVAWGNIKNAQESALGHLMPADLDSLAIRSRGAITVSPLPPPEVGSYRPPKDTASRLSCRVSAATVSDEWRFSSFSRLASRRIHDVEAPDHDATVAGLDVEIPDGNPEIPAIMEFPAGARAGTCLHEVFERVDFQSPEGPVVQERLQRHGFEEHWSPVILQMVHSVLAAPLREGFSLSTLGPADRVHEMEFTFPVTWLDAADLPQALPDHSDVLKHLEFRPHRGHMKGFIDLVFRCDDRYFLLDWKSNLLGSRPGDYRADALDRVMNRELYVLQYHIYTAALNRHLKARMPGYDYDSHFGGVFYLFLRGVPSGDGLGIYFDRPEASEINRLDRFFQTGRP